MSDTGRPRVVRTRDELDDALAEIPADFRQVGLVPTMGALHAGHDALLRIGRSRVGPTGTLVVSLFVNPLQFAPGEDLDRYPRTFEDDLTMCAARGVDVVFAPSVGEMYPDGESTVTVDPGELGAMLEGKARPGHFRGVLTVVARLFGLVRPDVAVFGEKDYQQLVLVRRMVRDLALRVHAVGAATVREDDGLALSSRNRYLDSRQRRDATALSRALRAGAAAAPGGAVPVLDAAGAVLRATAGIQTDYLELTDPELGPAPDAGAARLLVAARVGATRLIDNIPVELGR
ncbi:MAG TPA: pantoate--beta-alanine ligase [Nocardioidaceae bacterium]|nr:pantoate--beta-alanine ligase [Nocardioidaceae bacterium]